MISQNNFSEVFQPWPLPSRTITRAEQAKSRAAAVIIVVLKFAFYAAAFSLVILPVDTPEARLRS